MDELTPESINKAPETIPIPEQFVAAGKEVNIDLSVYFLPEPGDVIVYSIDDLPAGLSVDSETGVVSGVAPEVEMNQTSLINLVGTSQVSDKVAIILFDLTIVGTLLLDTPEARALFGLEEMNLWHISAKWEVLQFIQQLINEHYVFVYVHSSEDQITETGALLSTRKAETGWTINDYENCLLISPGEMTYEDYGNRARLIKTLEELYRVDLPKKGWNGIRLGGSDVQNVGKAWVVAKKMSIPISDAAPQEAAERSYRLIMGG